MRVLTNRNKTALLLMCCFLVGLQAGCKKKGGSSPPPPPGNILLQISTDGGRVAWYTGPAAHDLIAFDRTVNLVTKDTELFVMNADGSGVTDLTGANATVPVGFVGQPAWHPDGNTLIFQAENANSQHLRYNHVAWGINNDLWVINKNGTGAEMIYSPPLNGAALHPHFNASGTKLVFAERVATGQVLFSPLVTPGGENPWAGWRIHLCDYDGTQTGTAKLSNHVILFGAGLPQSRGFYETHGFVDATTLIFSYTPGGQAYVDDSYTCDLNGNNVVNLINSSTTWDEHGQFAPSGLSMAFISSRIDPTWVAPASTAATLRTELYQKTGATAVAITNINATGDSDKRYLVSDFDWDRTGRRIVFQVAPVDDLSGTPYTPEIWLLTFPTNQ